MSVFIIAEAACGWNGDLKQAEHSIRMAKVHGANAWKTQWTSDPMGMAGRRGINYSAVAEKLKRLAWPFEYHAELWAMCREYGIEYMCTTFITKDIEKVNPFVRRFKVSAFESPWHEFVEAHAPYGKPIIASTNAAGPHHQKGDARIQWLHCMSLYPTPLIEARVGLVKFLDGYSDHTTSTFTGALATACGARVIEKHVKTIDMLPSDPDQPHSLGMNGVDSDFGNYVRNIREAEKAL